MLEVRSMASNGVRSSQAISMILEVSPAVKMGSGFDMLKLYKKQGHGVAQVKKTLQLYGNISPCKKLLLPLQCHYSFPKSRCTVAG
jgi:hypothetical protein